jgi:16S rRNA processing protein RimM
MDLFVFGEIVKTRGLKGCLKALSFLESPDILEGLDFIYLESRSGQKSQYKIKKIDPAGKFLFIELKDISDVDAAQALVGFKLLLPRSLLDVLPADEYYWSDIIGLDVYTPESRHLGRIVSVFPTGSNDVYICRGDDGEILIPAIADVIVNVDLASHRITVNLPEGLLP